MLTLFPSFHSEREREREGAVTAVTVAHPGCLHLSQVSAGEQKEQAELLPLSLHTCDLCTDSCVASGCIQTNTNTHVIYTNYYHVDKQEMSFWCTCLLPWWI